MPFKCLPLLFFLLLWSCGSAPEKSPPRVPLSEKIATPKLQQGRKLMLIGLDGADWDFLESMITAGRMPELARLVEAGNSGPLASQHPPLSPLVWSTIATGVDPLEHRILDFTRVNPESGELEPITSSERAVPALWNMAQQAGLRSVTVGLWATHPAERVPGCMISDRFLMMRAGKAPPGSVFPVAQERWAATILADWESKVDLAYLRRYLPALRAAEFKGQVSQRDSYANPVSALWRILVETQAAKQLALEAQAREEAVFTFVYHQGSDSIGHVFAPYAAPKQPKISQQDFERYHSIPDRYFAELDDLLGAYRAWADAQDAVLLFVSDHGFSWGEGRPTELSSNQSASAAKWHRMTGIYLLYDSRGSKEGETNQAPKRSAGLPGSVTQVAGSVLALLGLAPASYSQTPLLPGVEAALAAPNTRLPGFDYRQDYQKPSAMAAPTTQFSDEELEKLRSLGYVGQAETSRFAKLFGTRSPGSFNNEGLLLKQVGKREQARVAFEQALAMAPDYGSAALNLADLHFEQDPLAEAASSQLLSALKSGAPEAVPRVIAWCQQYQKLQQPERSHQLLSKSIELAPKQAPLRLARARLLLERKACGEALQDSHVAVDLVPNDALAHALLGLCQLCLGNEGEANRQFQRALELDPNQPELQRLLRP